MESQRYNFSRQKDELNSKGQLVMADDGRFFGTIDYHGKRGIPFGSSRDVIGIKIDKELNFFEIPHDTDIIRVHLTRYDEKRDLYVGSTKQFNPEEMGAFLPLLSAMKRNQTTSVVEEHRIANLLKIEPLYIVSSFPNNLEGKVEPSTWKISQR